MLDFFNKYLDLFDFSKLSGLSIILYVWLGLIVFLVLTFFFVNVWFKNNNLSRALNNIDYKKDSDLDR